MNLEKKGMMPGNAKNISITRMKILIGLSADYAFMFAHMGENKKFSPI